MLDDELESFDDEPESFDDEPDEDDESLDVEPESLDDESEDVLSLLVDGVVDVFVPRLSFLKKPDPLKVTPTGWNTFLTDIISPESGCAYSVRVSSVNACWTSIVSPVSTNLYT